MAKAFLLIIVVLANDLFALSPSGGKLAGVRFEDMGLPLIVLGFVYHFFKHSPLTPLRNFFTWYIFYYLLLVIVQVAIASFKYSQPIIDGLIVARTQLYYLMFPLFLLTLDDMQKVRSFMRLISALALVIVALTVFNYFVATIFHGRLAEGHGERAGTLRLWMPGLNILVMAALWQFWSYLKDNRTLSLNLVYFLITFSTIISRQTRGRIIVVSAVMVLMLIAERRYRTLALGAALVVLAVLINFQQSGSDSILINSFESAYSDVNQGEGSWGIRLKQIESSWHVFVETFVTGSGGLVIRGTGGGWAGWGELRDVAFNTDLGYWVWFKFFGYPGILYLLALISGFFVYVSRYRNNIGDSGHIVQFAAYHFLCILISMVTINYFISAEGIIVLCLNLALLVKAAQTLDVVVKVDDEHALENPGVPDEDGMQDQWSRFDNRT